MYSDPPKAATSDEFPSEAYVAGVVAVAASPTNVSSASTTPKAFPDNAKTTKTTKRTHLCPHARTRSTIASRPREPRGVIVYNHPPRLSVAQHFDRNLSTRYSHRACEFTPARPRIMYQNITLTQFQHPRRAQDVASTSSFTDELNTAFRTVTAGVDRWPMSERTRARFSSVRVYFFVRAWVLTNANKYAAAYVVRGAGRSSPSTSRRRGVTNGLAFRVGRPGTCASRPGGAQGGGDRRVMTRTVSRGYSEWTHVT